jgi:methylated-DNA-[protein]-cysteine S-methyltransferase
MLATDLGPFYVVEGPDGVVSASWEQPAPGTPDETIQPELAEQLERYFAGEAVVFDAVAEPAGTSFQQRIRRACLEIPRGETISYAELAERAGASRHAARAAGQVMRTNPLPVVIPCHRVVGSDGALHGYAGSQDEDGGPLTTKRRLLELERCAVATAAG